MSNKPQLKYNDLEKIAKNLGFVFRVQEGSHMQYKHPITGRKVTIGKYRKPYSQDLISNMARQIGISKNELYKRIKDQK